MVRVVCNLAELLIVVTDINSDEEWDEDDQSQTEGAEECGARVCGYFALYYFAQQSKYNWVSRYQIQQSVNVDID